MALKPTHEELEQKINELQEKLSDQQRFEQTNDDSALQFRILAEASMIGIFIFQDLKFIYINPAATEIFEDSAGNMLKKGPVDYTHPDDHQACEQYILSQFSQNPDVKPFVFRGLKANGKEIYCEVQGRAIQHGGKPAIMGTLVDITEHKRAERALRESEEKLRNIIENSTNLFYSHTVDHKLTYLSPQSRDFLESEPEEAMVRWTEFATENPINEKGFASTEQAIKTGKRQPSYELELVGKKGRKIWVEVNEVPIVKNGEVASIVGSLTDITERKLAEEELKNCVETPESSLAGQDGPGSGRSDPGKPERECPRCYYRDRQAHN